MCNNKSLTAALFTAIIASGFAWQSHAAETDCSGEGKWEFGSKRPGDLEDENSPFIKGTPRGLCRFKYGEKQKLIDDVFANARGTKDEAVAVVTMGAPGCGKSSSLALVLQEMGYKKEDFVNIDIDDIKSKMKDFKTFTEIPSKVCPGKLRAYTGVTNWCAAPSGKVREEILATALREKRSFIMDGICRFEGYCKQIMEDAHRAGFTVYLVAVWAEGQTCTQRAQGRAFHNGRWAGPKLVLDTHKNLGASGTFNRLADLAVKFGGDAWIFNNEGDAPVKAYQRNSQCHGSYARPACEYYGVVGKEQDARSK